MRRRIARKASAAVRLKLRFRAFGERRASPAMSFVFPFAGSIAAHKFSFSNLFFYSSWFSLQFRQHFSIENQGRHVL